MPHQQKIVYGKLVRDRIPEIITADGQIPRVRVLDDPDLLPALIAKLHEEAEEVATAEPDARLGELADVREVLAALTIASGFTELEVEEAAASKRAERGGFTQRLWLDEVLIP
ncbi:nucleoside triphosphate pyrophosphohydrolase [Salinispora vitiensis]|uniref:nucleoside triphosphate pyrophosphohydrolase n=1 Tax=Salinispora vitiensis TaxID=999544 RepID=UPI00036DA22E|nr:nucleoside triphosphate pyrophosphohydrolase [Salinispora vitiensis]